MEHLKPVYHMRPPRHWVNDPNGPVFWRGEYHLFFQYNPAGAEWGNIHWGHAVSPDLLHWRFLPEALKPGPEAYDRDGIFSGGAIEAQDRLHLFYTGAEPQSQCLAVSGESGEFIKHPGNPLIPAPPPDYDTPDFRDPFVWCEEDGFRMIVASAHAGRGIVFIYRSQNLVDWEWAGEFFSEPLAPGVPAFECPLYFRVEGTDVLVISPFDCPFYLLGEVRDDRFHAASRGRFDLNPRWYAPNTLATPDGRRVLIAWHQEERPIAQQVRDGWSGCMSIPREVEVDADGRLLQKPLREMRELRREGRPVDGSGDLGRLPRSAELELSLSPVSDDGWSVEFRLSEDGDRAGGFSVLIEPDRISLRDRLSAAETRIPDRSASLTRPDGDWSVRFFLDGSVLEVFINEREAFSSRLYPATADTRAILLASDNVDAVRGTLYRLESIF